MAGGQSASFGQGSVASQEGSVPLAGTLLAGSQGFIDFPVDEAIAGEEATLGQASKPDYAHTHFIRLRSRKSGGGGTATLILVGSEVQDLPGIAVAGISAPGVTQVATLAQGAFGNTHAKLLAGIQLGGTMGQLIGNGSTPTVWTVGNISLVNGDSGFPTGQFSILATGPSSYAPGGTYDAVGGTALPTGMSLSPDGLLDVGSAAVGSDVSGVVFGYTEPGAIPDITIHSSTVSGVLPFFGSVYPCEGACPAGATLRSPEEPTLRSTVTSTWPDGSAQVVVFAGHRSLGVSSTSVISLQPTATPDSVALNAAFVDTLMTSIDFASTSGIPSSSFTAFSTPAMVWWANSQLICARYRHSLGAGQMEAVIDVHAFANGRAFVEVVIENGKMTIPTLATTPIPQVVVDQTYVGMTVTINGTLVATVNSSGMVEYAVHQRFRAWYCKTWIGGDPLTVITHDPDALQKHPMFWQKARAITTDFSVAVANTAWNGSSGQPSNISQSYAADLYVPWARGRYLPNHMEGPSEGPRDQIGPLTGWETDYLFTGSKLAANAVIQTSLCGHTYNYCWRDETTGLMFSSAQLQGRRQVSTTPGTQFYMPNVPQSLGNRTATMEDSHGMAAPMMAFMLRPSPCFIELAQKMAVFSHTHTTTTGRMDSVTIAWRGKGWGTRNVGLAVFLTPDNYPVATWKSGMRSVIASNADMVTDYAIPSWNTLNVLYDYEYNAVNNSDADKSARPRHQSNLWFQYYATLAFSMLSGAKILRGTESTRLENALAYMFQLPIRTVNECTNGEWRLQQYVVTVGDWVSDTRINQEVNWQLAINNDYGGTIADTTPGIWLFADAQAVLNWSPVMASQTGVKSYWARFFFTLALAKERGEPGAAAAWATVYGTGADDGGITNLQSMLNAAATQPQLQRLPR